MFVDILLGRPTAKGRYVAGVQLVLIVLWHFIVFPVTVVLVNCWPGYGATDGGRSRLQPPDWGHVCAELLHPLFAEILLAVVVVEGLVGWLVLGFVNWQYRLNLTVFVRAWWRVCRWGTVGVPVLSLLMASAPKSFHTGDVAPFLIFAFLIGLPAWLVRGELPRQRMTRWRPRCPECGYALRGLTAPRCPECGVSFPTDRRTFRRWAFRRLPWDRLSRGGRLFAYFSSLARIVFTPPAAARSVAIPDRWWRCGLWAGGHLLLAAIVAVALGNEQAYVRWVTHRIWPPTFRPPDLHGFVDPPLDRVVLWAAQSFLASLVPLLLAVAIAVAISLCVPRRHRAAKLGGVKWSLYLMPVMLLALITWYGVRFIVGEPAQTVLGFFTYTPPVSEVALWVLIVPYGVWWAFGVAANPYNRARHCTAAMGYALVFFAAWLLTTHVLFAPGLLEALR
jgi:hypothetical protein